MNYKAIADLLRLIRISSQKLENSCLFGKTNEYICISYSTTFQITTKPKLKAETDICSYLLDSLNS